MGTVVIYLGAILFLVALLIPMFQYHNNNGEQESQYKNKIIRQFLCMNFD